MAYMGRKMYSDSLYFNINEQDKFWSQLSWAWKNKNVKIIKKWKKKKKYIYIL